MGQLLLLLGGVVISLLLLFATMASDGLDFVEWGPIALSPVATMLGWAGGGEGAPLLITGVLYTFIAYRLAMRWTAAEVPALLSSQTRAFAAAGKIGVVSAGILLAVGLLLHSFAEDALARTVGVWAATRLDLTSLVFFSLFVGALLGLFALLSAGNVSLVGLLGLRLTAPAPVRYGAIGARRVLVAGGAGLLVLHTLGTLLDDFSRSGIGLGDVIAAVLQQIASLLTLWLDTAMLLLVGATKFLHDGGYRWELTGDVSAWMWLAIPILVGAYVAGGLQAAKSARPPTQAEAAKAALLVGPFVALVGLMVALGWAGQPFIEDIVPIAILLPTLWGIAALAGAWLWANQHGLGSGLVVERPQEHVAPPSAGQTPSAWPPPAGQTPAAGEPPPPGQAPEAWPPPSASAEQPPRPSELPPPSGTQKPTPSSAEPASSQQSVPSDSTKGPGTADDADAPSESASSSNATDAGPPSTEGPSRPPVACPTCGKESRGRFCAACGTKIGTEEA